MKFVFTDKKVTLPASVHAYAEKKVGKLDRYFKTEGEASVVFSVEKDRNNVELTVRSGGTIIRVAESTSDMFATVDAAVASVERQLRKNKARLEKRLRENAFERCVDVDEVSSFAPEAALEIVEDREELVVPVLLWQPANEPIRRTASTAGMIFLNIAIDPFSVSRRIAGLKTRGRPAVCLYYATVLPK